MAAFARTIGEEEFLALIDWKDDHWSFGRHFAHEPWRGSFGRRVR